MQMSALSYPLPDPGGHHEKLCAITFEPAGTESLLYCFAGGPSDGAYPQAGLIQGSRGNFYGTTYVLGMSTV